MTVISSVAPLQTAQELISRKDYQAAEALLNERLTREPNDADAFYLLGVMRYFQGKVGPTVEYLRKALELDPRHTDASVCLSILFNDIGKYDAAKEIFEKANQLVASRSSATGDGSATVAAPAIAGASRADGNVNRKFALKHLELAEMYFRYKRYDEAIEEYGKASLLDPAALDIRIRRAKAFAKKGFVSRAMQELQILKSEFPTFLPAKIQLGLLHFSQGNQLDAELEWQSVLEIEPGHREARSYIEMARQHQQR